MLLSYSLESCNYEYKSDFTCQSGIVEITRPFRTGGHSEIDMLQVQTSNKKVFELGWYNPISLCIAIKNLWNMKFRLGWYSFLQEVDLQSCNCSMLRCITHASRLVYCVIMIWNSVTFISAPVTTINLYDLLPQMSGNRIWDGWERGYSLIKTELVTVTNWPFIQKWPL